MKRAVIGWMVLLAALMGGGGEGAVVPQLGEERGLGLLILAPPDLRDAWEGYAAARRLSLLPDRLSSSSLQQIL